MTKEFRLYAAKNNVNKLKKVLNNSNNSRDIVNSSGERSGKTALHFAVEFNATDSVKYLIENAKADINPTDKELKTPLSCAAERLNTNLVEYLLSKGAKTLIQNPDNKESFITPIKFTPDIKILSNEKIILNLNFIIKKLKHKIFSEAKETALNIPNCIGIKLQSDGSLDILSPTNLLKEIKKPTFKTTVYSSNFGDINFANKKSLNKNFSQPLNDAYLDKLLVDGNYTTPPIIFFVNHENTIPFELLKANIGKFKEYGYTNLNFEFDENLSLDQTIKGLNYLGGHMSEIASKFFKFIRESNCFEYKGIDLNLGLKKRMELGLGSKEILSKFTKDNALSREDCMANNILNQNKLCKGASISIIGAGHMEGILSRLNNNDIFHNKFLIITTISQNTVNNEKLPTDILKLIFPNFLNPSAKLDDLSKKLFRVLDSKISESTYNCGKGSIIEIESNKDKLTTLSRRLKSILDKSGLPNSIKLRLRDSYYLDAILKVDSHIKFKEYSKIINSKLNLNVPLKFINIKHDTYLSIPCINSSNAKPINDAFYKISKSKKHRLKLK